MLPRLVEYHSQCGIVMPMTFRIAVAGAADTPAASCCGCCCAPRGEIGALTANSSAGRRLGEHQPHLLPLADARSWTTTAETLAGHDVVFLALPHGQSAGVAEQLGDDVLVVDCGADFRLADAADWERVLRRRRTPAPGPTACPSCPAQRDRAARHARGSPSPAATRPRVTLALLPGAAPPGWSSPTWSWSPRPAPPAPGKSLKPHLLGSEVMGSMSAVRRRRRPPAHPRDDAEPPAAAGRPVTVSFTPMLAPMARGILATCTRAGRPRRSTAATVRAAYEKAYADEPFVHLLPEGSGPHDRGRARRQHRAAAGRRSTSAAGRVVVVSAIDNLAKGTAGGAVQSMNLALGLPETTGPVHDRSRAVSVTAPQGFRAAGVAAGHQGQSGGPTSPWSSTTGPARAAAGVFTTNRVKAAPVLWSEQVARGRRWSRRRPQLRRRQRLHRARRASRTPTPPPRRSPRCSACGAGEVAVCSTGLIGVRLPMDKLLAGRRARPPRRCPATAARTPPTRS